MMVVQMGWVGSIQIRIRVCFLLIRIDQVSTVDFFVTEAAESIISGRFGDSANSLYHPGGIHKLRNQYMGHLYPAQINIYDPSCASVPWPAIHDSLFFFCIFACFFGDVPLSIKPGNRLVIHPTSPSTPLSLKHAA